MQFRSFIVFMVLALLAVDAMANRPSKKAMRNSLVRFGKRSAAAPSDFSAEAAPSYARWEYLNRLAALDGADNGYNL
ncbi:flp-32 [Pristionchus pacificus]|uniref:Flp-32 n=1 Tax=Pristionchus pacificus TaxID=54126 RepID=A0A2A6D349_PRIPA|nr:flp-32 [Pristionchus pacificus]|eukprot:PDM84737.1 flp-32 [Pristionchus pacificus]